MLRVSGTRRAAAAGRVRVEISQRIAGRRLRAVRTVTVTRGRFAVRVRLTGPPRTLLALERHHHLAGDARTPASIRLAGPGLRRSRVSTKDLQGAWGELVDLDQAREAAADRAIEAGNAAYLALPASAWSQGWEPKHAW